MEILAKSLEDARQVFLRKHEHVLSSRSREGLGSWIKHAAVDPVDDAVRFAMAKNGLDSPEIKRELYASLKFRVLAGILTMPVEYPDPKGGLCEHMVYDADKNSFSCEVEGNQDQADDWHTAFGHGPICPFYKSPNPVPDRDDPENRTRLDELLAGGEELEDALRMLGIGRDKA